jgi:amino acid adenylation domain-containing protein
MVPSSFVTLDALPLSSSGKLELKSLPAPDSRASAPALLPPRTPSEQLLASLWSELLAVPSVGATDNFFELGGHSLLATQLVSRVRSAFQIELPARELFEHPTVQTLAARLDVLLREGHGLQLPPLTSAPRTGPLPLSFAQQRLWFLDQLEPGSAAYNIPVALRLSGPLDVSALERSFSELVRRHEALRTTFPQVAGEPVQLISPPTPFLLAVTDLSAHPHRDAEALRLATDEASRPFDLLRGPLLRASLLSLGQQHHVLLLTMHHIVSDGWSMQVLIREMSALYQAFSSGLPSPLPELSLQYPDYALWQRSWLKDDVLQAQLSWWRSQLDGAPAAMELPTDFPRPKTQSFNGASVPVHLPRPLSDALESLCRREGVTPFMALLAAFQAFLSRYSGQDDISVGSPIAGRRFAELEGLLGFFVNTLVLRSRFAHNPSFRQLLSHVRDSTLGAFAHQDIPFEKLVEALQPSRDLSRSPLFQVMFVLQGSHAERPSASTETSLSLHPFEVEGQSTKFELQLTLSHSPDGFSGLLTFNTALFRPDTAQRMARCFVTLLDGLVSSPQAPFHHLPLLPQDELHRVLREWNHGPPSPLRDATVNDVFSRAVSSRPDAVAVEYQGHSLTYRQLDSRANQLAHHLLRLGVQRGHRVALLVERSLEMVVATLASLKAGAVYVPLDPAYPAARLSFMLEDTAASVLLAQEHLLPKLPSTSALVVRLDTGWDAVAAEPENAPDVGLSPDDGAYVMYTSGSTGRPKGVLIPHRGILRVVVGAHYAHFGPDETWLQLAPISFDASTLELWGALLNGGRLVVYPAGAPDLQELAEELKRRGVTSLWLPAALFELMASHQPQALTRLRQLLTGGDTMSPSRARELLSLGVPLINGYGPTETTVFAACHPLSRPDDALGLSIPIGRPIAGTSVYLLDSQLHPVPPGVPGELYIAGDGLALGYLNRPELTAERFVPHPFSPLPGARLYRSGDLARFLPDGTLEFLGRRDSQVKVRGFRIELGEVEAALAQHPSVREAVVLALGDGPTKRLVAYVSPSSDTAPLRDFLRQRLPEHMVPSAFVALERFPLTPNGKLDRKALPPPEQLESTASPAHLPPRTPTEATLASLWAELLHVAVDTVSATDDFFSLGGHSLLATQLVSRIRSSFHVELPLRALFERPTIEGTAELLLEVLAEQADPAELEQMVVALEPSDEDT